ncbi:MAG: dephospho-CoA kinase [Armatimonadota bacterium]|nr:dephospho-CoA kinase [Armatimonadota bacterium]MDR7439259.1 dephospho-CoA kinase [Armatimonadota bacterium]MDR7562036.1 dephospho-CoA kinase [Armatimonadota bacterium]MDR7567812.1 dephospho-CoA kinase [Armatimonadota bacterium]MDR7601137.1 dephospho-CoA kinase [Armatimonadota bacterium]
MKVVTLTGGVASGKSTVARMLRTLGAEVLDADQAAREVVEPGQPALDEIVEAFGRDLLTPDGRLDRRKLGALVFSDPEARRKLNAIVHPRILGRLRERLREIAASRPQTVVVVDLPLLFDVPIPEFEQLDAIVVYATPATQLRRLMRRDGLSEVEAEARLGAQVPLEAKLARARWVVDNEGPLHRTREQVERIWEEILADP